MDDDFRKKFALQKGNYMILKHLLIQKLDILSFFDKIFLFFFYSSKIIPTFAYRKTINIYRIQAQTNTIIYTQTRTIMKKTFTKKTLVAGIAAALMTLTATNVNAKETFIYGQNQQSLIVSTLNEDGKTLTPKWKYEYQYDTLGTMTEKKAYRWDAEQMTWTPAYLLTWKTEGPTLQKLSENKQTNHLKTHTLWDALSNYYCISSLTN